MISGGQLGIGEQAQDAERAQQPPLPVQLASVPPSLEAARPAAPQPCSTDAARPLQGEPPGTNAKCPSPLLLDMDRLQGAAPSPLNAHIFDDDLERSPGAAAPCRDSSNGRIVGEEEPRNSAAADEQERSMPLSTE